MTRCGVRRDGKRFWACIATGALALPPSAFGGNPLVFDGAGQFGGPGTQWGYAVAADGSGAAYLAGHFQNAVDFDPGAGTEERSSAGADDVYIVKLAADGAFDWAVTFGGAASDYAYDAAFHDGSLYVTGKFQGAFDFDPGPDEVILDSGSAPAIFVVRLSSDGEVDWALALPGTEFDRSAIAAGGGHIYVAGAYRDTADFGAAVHTSAGFTDVYIARIGVNGQVDWVESVGGTGADKPGAVAIDAEGGPVVTGHFFETVDFDSGPGNAALASAGDQDVFVLTLDGEGGFVDAFAFGGASYDTPRAVAVASDGDLVVGGSINGAADFDPGIGEVVPIAPSFLNAFAARYSATGLLRWAAIIGGNGSESIESMQIGAGDAVYATGFFGLTCDLDPGETEFLVEAVGFDDVFLMKLAGDGSFAWAGTAGGLGNDVGVDMTLAPNGAILVTGDFTGSGDFDLTGGVETLTSLGDDDAFYFRVTETADPGEAADINGDQSVDAVDIQLAINAVLGISIAPFSADVNGDQSADAVDIQLVINAALGLDL